MDRLFPPTSADFDGLPFNHIGPRKPDIFQMPSVQKILYKTPIDEVVTEEQLAEEFLKIPDYAERWRKKREERFIKMMRGKDIEDLKLATSVFRCRTCGEHLWYPRLLVHHCGQALLPGMESIHKKWGCDRIVFAWGTSEVIEDVLLQLDLVAEDITFSELESKNILVQVDKKLTNPVLSLMNLVRTYFGSLLAVETPALLVHAAT